MDSLREAIVPYYQRSIDKLDASGKIFTRVKVSIEAREVFIGTQSFGKEWKETATNWVIDSNSNEKLHSDVIETISKNSFFSLRCLTLAFPDKPQAIEITMKYRFMHAGSRDEIQIIDDQHFYLKM